jgi:plastocyanin
MYRRRFLKSSVAAIAATAAFLKISTVSASSEAPVNHTVEIANFVFSPEALSVRVGDRVKWINRDIVPHTATADDGGWDTGELGPNESGEIVVTDELATSYFCQFHPSMTAKLEVV